MVVTQAHQFCVLCCCETSVSLSWLVVSHLSWLTAPVRSVPIKVHLKQTRFTPETTHTSRRRSVLSHFSCWCSFQKTQKAQQIQIINRFPYSPLCCTPLRTGDGNNKQHYGVQFEISNEHYMFFFFPRRERDVLHTLRYLTDTKSFWDKAAQHDNIT